MSDENDSPGLIVGILGGLAGLFFPTSNGEPRRDPDHQYNNDPESPSYDPDPARDDDRPDNSGSYRGGWGGLK